MPRYISVNSALQAHPEFLNEQIDDHDKAVYAKGWNACNSAFYGAIKEQPTVSPDEVRGVGKWIRISGYHLDHEYHPARYQCDKCKHFVDSGDDKNYCPNCGAKMEVTSDV